MIQQLRTTNKGQGLTKAPQISKRNRTKKLTKLTTWHYACSNRMTQPREGERRLTEKREGKAWPSGENIPGNNTGRNTTTAAAKTAGPLAGDGEGDALRISLLRWGRRVQEKGKPKSVDCGLRWVFYEKYFGFTGLIRPILSVSPASLYGIIFIFILFLKNILISPV